MSITLRHYQPEDFQTLYRIDRACYEPGIAYSRRMLRGFLEMEGSHCHVASRGAEIVGFLITVQEGGRGHLVTLDVSQAVRRSGIGTALLRLAEHEMAQSGVREVTLETATNNQPAVAFWYKLGYQPVAILPRYYLNRIDAYLMTKTLSPAEADKQP